jgi:putative membrane-bound dehydrogenase-like protein
MLVAMLALLAVPMPQSPQSFEKHRLSDVFYCEGATFGDLDKDGKNDVVSGPFWYAGPGFTTKHELAEPKPFDPLHYSDNFFAYVHDFDRDGWLDVFFIGFPGERAWWARNPGAGKVTTETRWTQHTVFDVVDNEAPTFTDLTGDGQPELVCLNGGRYGYAAFDPKDPAAKWTFHPISPNLDLDRFTHGMGVGDVNGDGRKDLLEVGGWFEQPASLAGDPAWTRHEFKFGDGYGGAQMLVFDVDGDGDADVVTSLKAHEYGLSWFEQVQRSGSKGAGITFVEHELMGTPQEKLAGDVCFSELHGLDMADFDGDGLMDFVTGKRFWAHGPMKNGVPPGADDPAVLYWWKLRRDGGKASFEPRLIDDDSGVGVCVVAGDVDGDGKPDVVVGNKKGTFVHLQRLGKPAPPVKQGSAGGGRGPAPAAATDPHPGRGGGELPKGLDGHELNFDFETGDLRDWTVAEGDAFAGQPIEGDSPAKRQREPSLHQGRRWIGGYESAGDGPRGELVSEPFKVTKRWASFLIGGGGHQGTAMELVRDGEPQAFFRCTGGNYESMQPIVVDLKGEMGRAIRIRLIDEVSGGWGHVNFDDFRVHDEKPQVVRPPRVPEILEPDVVAYAGLSAEEAARAMTLPPGFQVDVVACEPDIVQPIALAVDGKRRLWVVQALSYPWRQEEGKGKDSIVVFEDKDGDGRFESRTLFADHLNLVSGIEIGFGGVFVGAAPYLYFFSDANDDLKPDGEPEVLLDGFGWGDTHETLNAFNWGPDGWLYGCHGVFTDSRVGKPGTPDDRRVPMNAAIWRYHPQRREFEIFVEGTSNPWGVDFDDDGEAFCTACVIPHLYHCVPGGRYIRQAGSQFEPWTYTEIDTIADHRHYAGGEPYVAIGRSGKVGGGHAHCGALMYLGDQFPPEYRNTLLMGNIHGNRVNRDLFERKGSGFVGRHGPDFLVANDSWFRHVGSRLGPDGEIYFIDWYDSHACHSTPGELWNRTNGRLYRVTYRGEDVSGGGTSPKTKKPDVAAIAPSELVALHASKNEWWVRQARKELQRRGLGGPEVASFQRIASEPQSGRPNRLRALWTLHACGKLDESLSSKLLADGDDHLRGWTIRLACERRSPSSATLAAMEKLAASDPSPIVRREIASALQRLPLDSRWNAVAALLAHGEDADDPNLPSLDWYALEPLVGADATRALALLPKIALPSLRRFVVRRAAAEPRCHDAAIAAVAAERDAAARKWMLEEIHSALREQRGLKTPAGWPTVYASLTKDPALERDALAVAIDFGDRSALPQMRAAVAAKGELGWRRQALAALVQLQDPEAPKLLRSLVQGEGASELRGDAIRALSSFADEATPAALLAAYPKLAPDEKRDALTTLSSRASFAKEMLKAMGSGAVARADLPATALRRVRELADPEVDALVKQHFGLVRDTPAEKQARIEELKRQLTRDALARADKASGRALFATTCMKCHVLFGAGRAVAPDITGANRADLDYLLGNVIDPNAVIGKDYQVTNLFLKDGRIVSGLVTKENESALTVVTENATEVVALADVDKRRPSPVSLMPEGQLDTMKPEEIRDLFAYLQSGAQVPMKATAATAPYLFDGRSLALWSGDAALWSVEAGEGGAGEIVGRTREGIARNSFLVSDLLLADFRLTLEVKLVDDQGNSGIQFRSTPLEDGEVRGYQADVGPGWWGKLYEEEGRGLLSDVSGEPFLKRGDWNLYEICAVGSRVRTTLNGRVTTDLDDPKGQARGQLALQLHSGGPTEVRFRNLVLDLAPPSLPPVGAAHVGQ